MFRVLVPNMRVALLTSAFLTATVVLGEFTMASLTGKQTLPTFQAELYSGEFQLGAAVSFVTLILTTALLAFVTFATGRRGAASTLA